MIHRVIVVCAGLGWVGAAIGAPPFEIPRKGLVQCQANLGACETALSCGNGELDANEECDLGTIALGGGTCDLATFGESPYGTLSCSSECVFDINSCVGRFEDTGETVIDHETGLEWHKITDDDSVTDKDIPILGVKVVLMMKPRKMEPCSRPFSRH